MTTTGAFSDWFYKTISGLLVDDILPFQLTVKVRLRNQNKIILCVLVRGGTGLGSEDSFLSQERSYIVQPWHWCFWPWFSNNIKMFPSTACCLEIHTTIQILSLTPKTRNQGNLHLHLRICFNDIRCRKPDESCCRVVIICSYHSKPAWSQDAGNPCLLKCRTTAVCHPKCNLCVEVVERHQPVQSFWVVGGQNFSRGYQRRHFRLRTRQDSAQERNAVLPAFSPLNFVMDFRNCSQVLQHSSLTWIS